MKRDVHNQRSMVKSIIFGFIILLLVIALIGSCTANDEEVIEDPDVVEAEKKVVQEKEEQKQAAEDKNVERAEEEIKAKEAEEKAKAEAQVEEAKAQQSALEQESLRLLQDSFKGNGEVQFDEEYKTFYITSTIPTFMDEVYMIANGEASMDIWYQLTDSMVFLSESVTGVLGRGYTVAMVNPLNPELMIIVVEDGVIVYDVMQDQDSPI